MTNLEFNSGVDLVVDMSDRLRIARIKAGLEQEEMAQILDVSSSTISNWENGRSAPKAVYLNAWAQVTGFNTRSLRADFQGAPSGDQPSEQTPASRRGGAKRAPRKPATITPISPPETE